MEIIHISKDEIPKPRDPYFLIAKNKKGGVNDKWKSGYDRKKKNKTTKTEISLEDNLENKEDILSLFKEIENWLEISLNKIKLSIKERAKLLKDKLEQEIKDDYYSSKEENIRFQFEEIKKWLNKLKKILK